MAVDSELAGQRHQIHRPQRTSGCVSYLSSRYGHSFRHGYGMRHIAMRGKRHIHSSDVSLTSHRDMAILSVTDTGCGIPAQEQTRIFERGYRTSAARNSTVPGTGLGLHFARCIAQAHGGDIEVISVPGQGSCFRVSLPLKTPPGAPAALNTEVHERTIN